MSYTPGPWIAGNARGGRIFKSWGVFASGKRIADVKGGPDVANATLMAAAPELLGAAMAAVDVLNEYKAEKGVWWDSADQHTIDKLTAAIAKARGQ